jgi:tetratricopeptide (TPR) repeat protein
LYEADNVQTVWSRRFDVPDRPNGWKSIIQAIYANFQKTTMDVEAARAMREHPDTLDKRDLLLAAGAKSLSPLTRENNLARIALIERALAIDPNDVRALRADAQDHAGLVFDGFSADREADLATAMKLIDRALLLAPNDVLSETVKASVLRAQGNLDAAAVLFRKVIELLPVQGLRYREFGSLLMAQGRFKEALENYVTAKELVTGTEPIALFDAQIASALLANDRYPEAITQARLAISEYPPGTGRNAEFPWLVLIAAESASGRDAEARANLQEFLATPRTWHTMAEIQKVPYVAANTKLLEGLRRAGMPAE